MRPDSSSTRSRSRLVALPGLVVAFAVAASGCVGKSGAVYSRPGTEPSQNPDASPGVDAPGPPDGSLPDLPVGTGPDLSIGGPDVPAGSPCANNVLDGTETDIDCGAPPAARAPTASGALWPRIAPATCVQGPCARRQVAPT